MASSSNPPDASARITDYEYLYASNTNVSNFVSVKLYDARNYELWKTQMMCLMATHDMLGLVDEGSIDSSMKDMTKYDTLLKGWIFGSVSEDVLRIVVKSKSLAKAKDVWNTLKKYFDATRSADQLETETNDKDMYSGQSEAKCEDTIKSDTKDSAPTKTDTNTETKGKNVDLEEMPTTDKRTNSTESEEAKGEAATQIETKDSEAKRQDATQPETEDSTPTEVGKKNMRNTKPWLQNAIADQDWDAVGYILISFKEAITEQINSDGNTALHMVVESGRNDVIKRVLWHTDAKLTNLENSDGSTLLHIAATVGNTDAAKLLIKKDTNFLSIFDKKNKTPLDKAYENMHLDTIAYLLEAASVNDSYLPHVRIGSKVLVNAISAKKYEFATKLLTRNSKYAVLNDDVLMAIARTFPSGLGYVETLFYPSWDYLSEMIVKRAKGLFNFLVEISSSVKKMMSSILRWEDKFKEVLFKGLLLILGVPAAMVYWIFLLICLILLMVYFPFSIFYYLFWKVAMRVVSPIRNIEEKKTEQDEAKNLLVLVCEKINETDATDGYQSFYTGPILEAACQDAYEVVVEILKKWPKAIRCEDENGYDIMQLATVHRSEKIYNNMLHLADKNIYRTRIDSSKNNMLHLASRLAPSNKLKLRTGAALQLQRELQWREEVKELVFPSYTTKENIFKDTPDMVFTKEHENLVKEGEKWIKTVAESCSITAALITTIVFAAAITVPGGSSQEGIPVFRKEVAFTIFAIADAISLFSSATALLVFLSILTARFAEQDFLVRLPRRIIIGLCTLLLSTASMMVAFGATLFLVFCHDKFWMVVPLCGLAFLPIGIFFILQFPLILDLIWSTYISKFGKSNHNSSKFNPNGIRFFFGK